MRVNVFLYVYFFFIYAFLGWVIEEISATVKYNRFVNRGFVNGPLCVRYGFIMVMVNLIYTRLSLNTLGQVVFIFFFTSAVEYVSGVILKHITGRYFWDYSKMKMNINGYIALFPCILLTCAVLLAMWLVNPFLYMVYLVIPGNVMGIIEAVLMLAFICDLFVTVATTLKWRFSGYVYESIAGVLEKTKKTLGMRLFLKVEKRLYKAFPEFIDQEKGTEVKRKSKKTYRHVFAKGMCFDKMVWLFLISAFVGDIIETVYVWATEGVWMSRSGVLYGAFSIIWGFGGLLITVLLYRFRKKNMIFLFAFGFIFGGVYEYVSSWVVELLLGTSFWDYNHLPYNIDGRANLLFCVFWGILSIVWFKFIYPGISWIIEKIPPMAGKVGTIAIVIFMTLDILLSNMAVIRYVQRNTGSQVVNAAEEFLDYVYPDNIIQTTYPYMKIVK